MIYAQHLSLKVYVYIHHLHCMCIKTRLLHLFYRVDNQVQCKGVARKAGVWPFLSTHS